MKRLAAVVLVLAACASPAPPPAETVPEPQPVAVPKQEAAIGTVRVTTSVLNVRKDGSLSSAVIAQVKKGDRLALLADDDQWMRVRIADGTTGYVSAPLVKREGVQQSRARKGCPADADYSFAQAPLPSFSDRATAHGIVTVDATVDTKGNVTSTKVISNSTGDETLAFLAEREIQKAKFVAPIRNCAPRPFIFTYTRTF
jgi:TonB family protein